ncbi:hypothetical protein MYA98_01660 [Salmonella sp. WGH-01]|nr:hypothetical protein MYA98_01660 [Salmonella sp. WGH-01]
MSRTTILDDATASDIDEQRHSQPVQFIKRGTAPFMRVTLALFPRAGDFRTPLLRSAYTTGTFREFGVSPPAAAFHFLFLPPCWLSAYFYRPAF